MSASTSSAKSKSKPTPLSDQEISQNYSRMQNELQVLASKISELESESEEHGLVLATLNEALAADPDRKCFRLIGGVLVERTVKDVVPALQTNRDGLKKVMGSLAEQYKTKEDEFDAFRREYNSYLWGHNQVRLQHASPGLVWNETLADRALQWASFCRLQHSRGTLLDGEPYGENLVAGTGEFPIEDAMAQFTLDESDFDPSNPTYNHWTQVVWASTTQLGCASVSCSNLFAEKATYYVCLYSPPGNVIGQASDNVNVF
ncbi:Pathogenesis-related protein 1 [Mycena kentingensis (nom. inval.)]|nr:Pathogenesis-related protein 1 [Mycena kentingensis (nom. inval.)]